MAMLPGDFDVAGKLHAVLGLHAAVVAERDGSASSVAHCTGLHGEADVVTVVPCVRDVFKIEVESGRPRSFEVEIAELWWGMKALRMAVRSKRRSELGVVGIHNKTLFGA